METGDINSARREYAASYESFKQLAETPAASEATKGNYTTALAKMAEVERKSGNHAASLSWTLQALAADLARYQSHPESIEAQRDYSQSLYAASTSNQNLGRLDEAERLMQQCLKLDRDTLSRSGDDVLAKRDLLLTLVQIGALHRLSGDLVGARRYLAEAAHLSTVVSHPSRDATLDHAFVNINLARTALDQRGWQEATDLVSETDLVLTRLISQDPSDEEARSNLAMMLWVKARVEESQGRFHEAADTCQIAITSLEALGPNMASETQTLLTVIRIFQGRQRLRFLGESERSPLKSILTDPRTDIARKLADPDVFAAFALAEIDMVMRSGKPRAEQEFAAAAKRDVQSAMSLAPTSVDIRQAAAQLEEMERLIQSQ